MKTVVKKLYEGMFLIDSALAASDWDGINKAIKTIFDRAGAELISQRKWDERKLSYEIDRKQRGTYILCYFRVEGPKIKGIERDILLSENIVRAMILNVDHMTQADIEKDTPAQMAEKQPKEAAPVQAEEPKIEKRSARKEFGEDIPDIFEMSDEDSKR